MNSIGYCRNCNFIVAEGIRNCRRCRQEISVREFSILIGKKFNKYIITDVIGTGGMSVVFRAQHEILSNFVAIKMLLPQIIDESMLKRFNNGARILANLRHQNIVEVYDADINEYGLPYYVMECLEGISLRQLLRNSLTPLQLNRASAIMLQIINGLAYAHKRGIIHRDLKPENIFLSKVGDKEIVKILDFGIAKVFIKDQIADFTAASLTHSGTIIGTPFYISPEQLMGKKIDCRTDVYSAGLIFYEMITGNMPAANISFSEIILYHLNEMPFKEVDSNKDLPEIIKNFLKRCLRKDAEQRYASAVEMKDDFPYAGETIRVDKEAFVKKESIFRLSFSDKIATIDLKLKSFSIPERVKRFTKIIIPLFILILSFVLIYFGKAYFSKEKLVQSKKEGAQSITAVNKMAILNKTSIPSDTVDLERELISEDYD